MRADLHRHLGGSISCEVVSKLKKIPVDDVMKSMTYHDDEGHNYDMFFEKFKIMDDIEWSLDHIDYTVHSIVWQLKKENLDYSEIKFSVNKYLPYINMTMEEITLWLVNCFDKYASRWDIEVDMILSLKHDMEKSKQLEISNMLDNDHIAECIAGIDIVGNEKFFDVDFYKPIFKRWNDAGKATMAHVGEINRPDNVTKAIEHLNLDRVCHGIASANDIELAKIARDKLIGFDICLTSNHYTGVANLTDHPVIKMLENGFPITIGTDDPAIFGTTYDDELELFKNVTGASDSDLQMIQKAAHSFSAREICNRKK